MAASNSKKYNLDINNLEELFECDKLFVKNVKKKFKLNNEMIEIKKKIKEKTKLFKKNKI